MKHKAQGSLNYLVTESCPKHVACEECDINHRCNSLAKDYVDKVQQAIDCQFTVEEIELFEFMSTAMKSKSCFNKKTKSLYESMKIKLSKQKEMWEEE